MGVGKRRRAIRAMRGQMWSPGRPSTARREDRIRFWEAIARGASSEGTSFPGSFSRDRLGSPSKRCQPNRKRHSRD